MLALVVLVIMACSWSGQAQMLMVIPGDTATAAVIARTLWTESGAGLSNAVRTFWTEDGATL